MSKLRLAVVVSGAFLFCSHAFGLPPGAVPEVTGLRFDTKTNFHWDAAAGVDAYHVYRGLRSALPGSYGNCFHPNIGATNDQDLTANPSTGQVFIYLITANKATTEGTMGFTSAPTERPNLFPCVSLPPPLLDTLHPNGPVAPDGVSQGIEAARNPGILNDLNHLAGGGIYMHTGEYFIQQTDLEVPGRGISWRHARYYRSQIDHDGQQGHNWTFNYDRRLRPDGGGGLLHMDGTGREDRYTPTAFPLYEPVDPGLYSKLRQELTGRFTLRERDGTLYRYFGFTGSTTDGRLESIQDKLGNRITFQYYANGLLCSAVDTVGRSYFYFWSSGGRLQTVEDYSGRQVRYTYDAFGDLVSVRSPVIVGTSTGNDFPAGKTIGYTYSNSFGNPRLNHNLLTITAPDDASPYVNNTYNPDDEVGQQFMGGLNGSGIFAGGLYQYSINKPGGIRQMSVLDRVGVTHTFDTDLSGHVTREVILGFQTFHSHNAAGERLQTTFPETNQTTYQYDDANPDRFQRGNLIQVRRIPDAPRGDGFGGPLATISVVYQYDPLYAQQRTIVDPAGRISTYTYDYQEGNPAANGVNALVADWQIALGGAPLSIGDVNGDGIVTQNFGNPVRLVQPTVTLLAGSRQAVIEGAGTQPIVTRYRYNALGQISVEVDPEFNVKTYQYFPETDPDGDGVASPAPIDGRVLNPATGGYLSIAIVDDDPAPYLTPIEVARRDNALNPAAAKIQNDYSYDAAGNLVRSIDGNGVATVYEVNARGQVVSVRRGGTSYRSINNDADPPFGGFLAQQIYNARDEIVERRVEDLGGASGAGPTIDTTFDYDILGNLVRMNQEAGLGDFHLTEYRYDAEGNRIATILPAGNVHTMAYDGRDLLRAITRGDTDFDASNAPPVNASQQTYSYTPNGNPSQFIDGRGQPWTFQYDGLDRRVRGEIVPGSTFFDVSYDPRELIRQIRVRTGGGTVLYDATYGADDMGRVTSLNQAILTSAGAPINESSDGDNIMTLRTEYDRNSRRSRVTTDSGISTDFDHDGAGRMVHKKDAVGDDVRYTYDDNGNPLSVLELDVAAAFTEATSSTSAFDRLNRLTLTTDNAGATQRFLYDSRDNQIGLTDALGNTTTYRYDATSRRVEIVRDLRVGGTGGGPIFDTIKYAFEYDDNGRLTKVIDPQLNETRYVYDAVDRKTEDRFDDGTLITYGFDANDNVVQVVDANGSTLTIAYDPADRPMSRSVLPAPGVHANTQSFTYDGFNRLIAGNDLNDAGPPESTQLTFQYDSLNRIRTETSRYGANPVRTFTYTYTADGNRATANMPLGGALTHSYDAVGRLSSMTDPVSGYSALYSYLGLERLAERRHGNGTRKSYLDPTGTVDQGYDLARRVRAVRHYNPASAVLAGFDYQRDPMGNILREDRLHNPPVRDQYQYDSAYRIVRYDRDLGGGSPQNVQYTLDRVGNWIQRIINGTPFGYTPNNLNEYDEPQAGGVRIDDGIPDDVDDNLLTGIADGKNLGHDKNGDLTVEATRIYQYDAYHRLVSVLDDPPGPPPATVVAHYVYDALNRRIAKMDLVSGVRRRFLYDGDGMIAETSLTAANVEGAAATRRYRRGVGGELVAIQNVSFLPAGLFYIHDDARGSVVMVTDAAAGVVERVTYDAEGAPRLENAANVPTGATESLYTPFLWQQKYYDPETKNYEDRGAMYAPRMGRHLQRIVPGQSLGPLAAALNPPMYFPVPVSLMGMNPFWWCKGWFWRPQAWWGGWWAWRIGWWWGGPWGWWWWSPWLWWWGPFAGWWVIKPWWFWWGAPFRWWGWPAWWWWPGWWGWWPWWGWFGWGGWIPAWGWLGWANWWPWWGWWGWAGWNPWWGWWGWYGWWPFWNIWWAWNPWWWWGWWTWTPWWWWGGFWSWSGIWWWWNWYGWLAWWPWGWWNWLPWFWWWGWWGWNPWWWWGWWGWWWWGWIRGWNWWWGGFGWWAWWGWGWWGWWWKGWWAWWWPWAWWAWAWGWWWPWWWWGWGWWPWWWNWWWWRWPVWGFRWWGWWWPWWGWWW